MTLTNILRLAGSSMLLFVCAGFAAAQGQQFDTPTTTSSLAMTATVQTSIQLNLSTGTGGSAVTGSNVTGDFAIGFGSVNGLGLGTPATGVSVAADATGATYSSPINMTPIFTGFPNPATASVTIDAGVDADQAIAREGATAATMTAVTTNHASLTTVASESVNERFVGFRISRTEVAGPKAATLVYTITVD
jgi:hypothetical protein